MKKLFSLFVAFAFSASIIFFNGCKKVDSTPPVITLKGLSTVYLVLGKPYTELGATATDNKDGDITSNITTKGKVDTTFAGSYIITYSVSDAAGNLTTAIRTVDVYNQASLTLTGTYLSGGVIYSVTDSVVSHPPDTTFTQIVTFSNTVNNRFYFSQFANYINNIRIYADITSSTTINISSQTVDSIGIVPTDYHAFVGSGVITGTYQSLGTKLILNFTDNNTTQSTTATHYEWFQ